MQVQVITNGDYVINPLEGHNTPHIIFYLVIHQDEVEVIVLAGAKVV